MTSQTTMRILRERAGLSQTGLAKLLGRAQPEVSMWEWGKERMPDAIRHQVYGILRARLPDDPLSFVIFATNSITPEDLDRPWDEVLLELRGVSGPAQTPV